MRRLLFGLIFLGLGTQVAQSQHLRLAHDDAAPIDTVRSILRNSVSVLHAESDTLWVGPGLHFTTDGGQTWLAVQADSVGRGARNRVFSLDVEDDVLWAGLAYFATSASGEGAVATAGGFLRARNGVSNVTYLRPALDSPNDTSVVYGGRRIRTRPDVRPGQSPPYSIDYDPTRNTVWVAVFEGGLRRSTDGGETWERVVLPPDTREAIAPDSTYPVLLAPKQVGEPGNENHKGFSVLVDETGTVWAGTAAGVNRSTDGGTSWRRFHYDGTPGSLTGNWVVALAEQPRPDTNAVWMASWRAGQGGEFGVTVTRDGGQTLEQVLRTDGGSAGGVIDFAFRGDTVYAAAQANGLLSSTDGGRTWESERTFGRAESPFVNAVATTSEAVWVGTSVGLYKSTDGGATWTSFEVDVPTNPETPTAEVPRVDAYAYPNPFSPRQDRRVRIRYEGEAGMEATVRLFDFNMDHVRTLRASCASPPCDAVWDGTDEEGLRVANGVYFYVVDTGEESARGKILVLQ